LEHADEAVVQHVQQLDDAHLLADVLKADLARVGTVLFVVGLADRGVSETLSCLPRGGNRFEYTQLDEFHENRGRAGLQLYSRLIPAIHEASWTMLQQLCP
jgi:hypothetical protein